MAVLFDDASSQSLDYAASALVTAVPLTMACHFQIDAAADCGAMSLGANSTDVDYFLLRIRGDSAGVIQAVASDSGGARTAQSSAGKALDTWGHAAAVFTSTTSRSAYLDGANVGNETTSCTPSTLTRTAIGRLVRATPTLYYSGRLADAAIWNVALTAEELLMLAKGVSPLLIRPLSLLTYHPLDRGSVSGASHLDRWNGRFDFTASNGPTITDAPRLFLRA